ncbi:MAG: caspase family protein [Clostridium sp.]|nr:caspase family protein [Clostridium sp.]
MIQNRLLFIIILIIQQVSLYAQNVYVLNPQSKLNLLKKASSLGTRNDFGVLWKTCSYELLGKKSKMELPSETVFFFIHSTSEVNIESWALSSLKTKKNSRLLPYSKTNPELGTKSAFQPIEINIKPLSNNDYIIFPKEPLSEGEYAFFRIEEGKPIDVYDFRATTLISSASLPSKEAILSTLNPNKSTGEPNPISSPTPIIEKQFLNTLSDVDVNIPINTQKDNLNTYCVIIANEKYKDVPDVEFAQRDGEIFKEYCHKTMSIPEKQIKIFTNASYTDIKRALNWMETMANVTEGNSRFLFYYAGHGIPDEKEKTAYLIPTDGFPKDLSTCFKLNEIYERLGKLKTENITILLDACFSGVKRGTGQPLIAARGIAIKPKEETLNGNMVVFTAASDDETALSYQEKCHGMFTYFLLSKLKESKGKISLGELFHSVSSEVKKKSMLENEKLQTPSVNVSANMRNKWEYLSF